MVNNAVIPFIESSSKFPICQIKGSDPFHISESGKRWPFQFAKDGIWMYGGCFLGCETSGGSPNHQSTQCIGGLRLSHSIGHKHR